MKIAYLILAHEQPSHFKRLINALEFPDTHFFVHLDAKQDIRPFEPHTEKNITFIADRVDVNHSGFTLTQALINLIRTAYRFGKFDYYISLSGRDYPIRSTPYIRTYLSRHAGTNFINFYPLLPGADRVENIRKYYFIDTIAGISLGCRYIRGPLNRLNRGLNRVFLDRPFIDGLTPYRGSVWWGLTEATVGYLVHFIESRKNRKFINFFKQTNCSDEIFFQTIILNSPYARECRFYERDILNGQKFMKNENKAYLHYVDWDPAREAPAVLDMADYEELRESDALFARKFDEIRSEALLRQIDRMRKNAG